MKYLCQHTKNRNNNDDSTYTIFTAFISNIDFLYYLSLIITKSRFEKDKVSKIKKEDGRGDYLAKVDKEDLGDLALTPRTAICFC